MSLFVRDHDGNIREVSSVRVSSDLLRKASRFYGGRSRGFNVLIESLLREWLEKQRKDSSLGGSDGVVG